MRERISRLAASLRSRVRTVAHGARTRVPGVVRRADRLVRQLPGGRATATAVIVLAGVPFLLSPQPGEQLLAATVDVAPGPETVRATGAPDLPVPSTGRSTASANDVAGNDGSQSVQPGPGLAEQVRPLPPDFVVRPQRPLDAEGLFAVLGVDGVEHLAAGAEVGVEVNGEKAGERIKLLVVDPLAFRPLTPESTAQAKAVWERLHDGDLVVRHDVAERLGLPLGGEVTVTGADGEATLRIGAYASNGAPPLADGIVSWASGSQLGVRQPNVLVIAAADDRKSDDVGAGVSKALGGADVTPLEQPERQRAQLLGAGATRFESFSYIDHGDGMITIDPKWVRRWIVRAQVPVFGEVTCHRYMVPQLRAALQEVVDRGLHTHIDRSQYGGCWVPRHMLFDPSNPISMHAWGIAIDFNVSTNQYGARPRLDRRIVEIFERWGFRWGGDWRTPDGMHFELATIITE